MSETFWAPLRDQVEAVLKIKEARENNQSQEVSNTYDRFVDEGKGEMSRLAKSKPKYNDALFGVAIPVSDAAAHFREHDISRFFWDFFDRNTKQAYRTGVYQHATTPESEVMEAYLAFGMFDIDPFVETKVVELRTAALGTEPKQFEYHWAFGLRWKGLNRFRFDTPGVGVSPQDAGHLHELADTELITLLGVHGNNIKAHIEQYDGPGRLRLFAKMHDPTIVHPQTF